MKKLITLLMVLCVGFSTSFAQQKVNNEIALDKSFEDAGAPPTENVGYHLVPKYCRAGEELSPQPPIALSAAKKEAIELGKAKPSQLRKDCLNIIYTVDPIYKEGIISGVVRGTIVMKWDLRKRIWVYSYLKYQLLNIEQNTVVFHPEIM